MKKVVYSKSFLNNWKKLEKKHYDKQKMLNVVSLLISGDYIPAKYHDHALKGDLQGLHDIHVADDWAILYQSTDTEIIPFKTGSHDDIF